ncbi:hypothetical protein [Niabella beijingensis]|uniref:hypothetical protein n=1 Tax=Niabella beijingensis TaxID=2872700 RepID=UPI001CBE5A4B|nr:hypothetical protein [Niabella beijingensis]MBZ4190546.1 hypothetical protein [Niabella beijingensis]
MSILENENCNRKLFLIGSNLDAIDSIIVKDSKASLLLFFNTFEKAKASFAAAYKILLAPSFCPSFPPSMEEILYHNEFMKLIAFSPVILEFDRETYKAELQEWRDEASPIFQTGRKFYNTDYWHCPMKKGFLQKYNLLDIASDIETTPFIGADGKMVLRINKISHPSTEEYSRPTKQTTREEIDRILRARGYL